MDAIATAPSIDAYGRLLRIYRDAKMPGIRATAMLALGRVGNLQAGLVVWKREAARNVEDGFSRDRAPQFSCCVRTEVSSILAELQKQRAVSEPTAAHLLAMMVDSNFTRGCKVT